MMKRLLSLVVAFAVLLMPMGAIAGELQTAESEDTWDRQETQDSETVEQTQAETSSEDDGGSEPLKYTLDYLFLENGEVSLGDAQTIAAHLNEDTNGIDEANLAIVSNGQEYIIPAEQIVDGYIQFKVGPDILTVEGLYSIVRLDVTVELSLIHI